MESPEFAAGVRTHAANGAGTGPTSVKRKRSTVDSSPASAADHDSAEPHEQEHHDHEDRPPQGAASPETKTRRLPGVKRACNECRQQKVGCFLNLPALSCPALFLTCLPICWQLIVVSSISRVLFSALFRSILPALFSSLACQFGCMSVVLRAFLGLVVGSESC